MGRLLVVARGARAGRVTDQRISVVMPTYNRARFIGEALDSVARQTHPPFEILVVDDCSTDDTRRRVKAHPAGSRLRYHLQPENRGASVARNTAAEMARGNVLVFLDSDDLLEPDHHETVLKILADAPSVGLIGCDCIMIGPDGTAFCSETWTAIQTRIKEHPIGSGRRSLADIFLFSTPFPGMTIRRDVYRSVGGLEQALFPLDDYDLQLKVAAAGFGVYYEHRALARYRIHGSNESGAAQAIRVGERKLRCIELAEERYEGIRALGRRVRRRRGEVRRELAIALLKQRRLTAGLPALLHSLVEDPGGLRDLSRIGARRLRLA